MSTLPVPNLEKSPRRFHFFSRYDLCVLAYLLAGLIITQAHGLRFDLKVIFDFKYIPLFVIGLIEFLIVYLFYLAFLLFFQKKDTTIFGATWRAVVYREYLTWQRLYDLCHVFVALQLALAVHAILKQSIPLLNSKLYDPELLWIDCMIHGGVNPISWLTRHASNSSFTTLIDRLYFAWFQVQLPVVAVFVLTSKRSLSQAFFFAFFALWLFGGLLSLLFPSWGPVYYYPEWFHEIVRPSASLIQNNLMAHYQQYLAHPGTYAIQSYEGVAAFPSLHVGIVSLFAFFIWRLNKFFSIAMGVYALSIQLGSILLGWHYAIDGYFSAGLAYLLYRVAVRLEGLETPALRSRKKL